MSFIDINRLIWCNDTQYNLLMVIFQCLLNVKKMIDTQMAIRMARDLKIDVDAISGNVGSILMFDSNAARRCS